MHLQQVHDLRATMRKLAFMVHPDRARSLSPAAAAENAESLAALQGMLTTVQKARDSHPPAGVRTLRFHLVGGSGGGGVRTVQQVLRTTGGDCRRVVERALSDLFAQCGLPRAFRWGDGDWALLTEEELKTRDNRGDGTTAAAAEPEAAAEPVPPAYDPAAVARQPSRLRDSRGAPRDLAAALAALDPLLNALAAVPWLPATPEGAERRHYLLHTVVRELEADGWQLERGCAAIWAGERAAEALLAAEAARGVDAASQEALKQVLFHARALEAELGPPNA